MLSREEPEQARLQRSRTIDIEDLRPFVFRVCAWRAWRSTGTFRLDRRLSVMR
jgi:hypothetical protein